MFNAILRVDAHLKKKKFTDSSHPRGSGRLSRLMKSAFFSVYLVYVICSGEVSSGYFWGKPLLSLTVVGWATAAASAGDRPSRQAPKS